MYEQERLALVNSLRNRGIQDEAVLSALLSVERHLFVPQALITDSYKDCALFIGYGQTISQPYTVAFMTQALRVFPEAKILEIGTGSGYQAAILHAMNARVFTIERNYEIYKNTRALFESLSLRILPRYGDGTIGWNEYAPFDRIIVTAGGPAIPESLKKQLAVNGRMVVPVGDRQAQEMHVITRTSESDFVVEKFPKFAFVPLIGKEGWNAK